MDECSDVFPCGENSICTNTDGSFECSCSPGFSDDPSTGNCQGNCIYKYINSIYVQCIIFHLIQALYKTNQFNSEWNKRLFKLTKLERWKPIYMRVKFVNGNVYIAFR